MTEASVTILLPPSAARSVNPAAPLSERLACAAGGEEFPPALRAALHYLLAHDPHQDVRDAAVRSLRQMPELDLLEVLVDTAIHPRILDAIARLHHDRPEIADIIALNPSAETVTVEYLAARGSALARERLCPAEHDDGLEPLSAEEPADDEEPAAVEELEDVEEEQEVEEEGFLSKYQLAQQMSIAEKIKTALTGDKEWRGLLIKDSNKLVSSAIMKNPRITEPEVLTICKGVVQNDDIIRLVCANKEWVKNYQIRKALVTNSKTPLAKAIRYLNTLTEKDIASLAKSKNVSSVISTQARRIVSQKQAKR